MIFKRKLSDAKILSSLLFIYICLVLLLFFVESGQSTSNIDSIGDAVWYSIVTLTTVGYGDFYPVTGLGKFIGVLLVLGSLGVVGFVFGKLTEKYIDMRERKKLGLEGTDFQNHVIIIGWNNFSLSVGKQLVNSNHKISIITDNKDDVDLIYQEFSVDEVFVLFTGLKNVKSFEKANISKAFFTFVNLDDDTEKLMSIINIKNQFPDSKFLVTLNNSELKDTFQSAGVTYALSKNEISSKLMASFIFEPDVADFTNDLLTSAKEAEEYDIQQFRVTDENPYLGKTYGDAFLELKTNHNVVLIGLAKHNGGNRELLKLPEDETKISKNDYLILIVNGEKESVISDLFKIQEGVTR